jgi:hypothetical protein
MFNHSQDPTPKFLKSAKIRNRFKGIVKSLPNHLSTKVTNKWQLVSKQQPEKKTQDMVQINYNPTPKKIVTSEN